MVHAGQEVFDCHCDAVHVRFTLPPTNLPGNGCKETSARGTNMYGNSNGSARMVDVNQYRSITMVVPNTNVHEMVHVEPPGFCVQSWLNNAAWSIDSCSAGHVTAVPQSLPVHAAGLYEKVTGSMRYAPRKYPNLQRLHCGAPMTNNIDSGHAVAPSLTR